MFFCEPAWDGQHGCEYHQWTAVLLIFSFVSKHWIQISILWAARSRYLSSWTSLYLIFNLWAVQNWCKRPWKMQFISSTKYFKTRWGGHFMVILVLLVSCSIPVFKLKNAFSWAAWNKTAIHKQHIIISLLINDYHLNNILLSSTKHNYKFVNILLVVRDSFHSRFCFKSPSKKTAFHEQLELMS